MLTMAKSLYIGVSLPLCVWGVISWLRHMNKEAKTIEIQKVQCKERLYISLTLIIVSVATYFLLRALNTKELLVSTLSVVITILASKAK